MRLRNIALQILRQECGISKQPNQISFLNSRARFSEEPCQSSISKQLALNHRTKHNYLISKKCQCKSGIIKTWEEFQWIAVIHCIITRVSEFVPRMSYMTSVFILVLARRARGSCRGPSELDFCKTNIGSAGGWRKADTSLVKVGGGWRPSL